jgi:hypothetical protein
VELVAIMTHLPQSDGYVKKTAVRDANTDSCVGGLQCRQWNKFKGVSYKWNVRFNCICFTNDDMMSDLRYTYLH